MLEFGGIKGFNLGTFEVGFLLPLRQVDLGPWVDGTRSEQVRPYRHPVVLGRRLAGCSINTEIPLRGWGSLAYLSSHRNGRSFPLQHVPARPYCAWSPIWEAFKYILPLYSHIISIRE